MCLCLIIVVNDIVASFRAVGSLYDVCVCVCVCVCMCVCMPHSFQTATQMDRSKAHIMVIHFLLMQHDINVSPASVSDDQNVPSIDFGCSRALLSLGSIVSNITLQRLKFIFSFTSHI